jgi:hypothetical protein
LKVLGESWRWNVEMEEKLKQNASFEDRMM